MQNRTSPEVTWFRQNYYGIFVVAIMTWSYNYGMDTTNTNIIAIKLVVERIWLEVHWRTWHQNPQIKRTIFFKLKMIISAFFTDFARLNEMQFNGCNQYWQWILISFADSTPTWLIVLYLLEHIHVSTHTLTCTIKHTTQIKITIRLHRKLSLQLNSIH